MEPASIDGILEDPRVTNLTRVTLELQYAQHSEGRKRHTIKPHEYQALLERIEPKLSPYSQRHLTKLYHGTHQTLLAI